MEHDRGGNGTGGLSVFSGWLAHHVNGQLFQLGRLQLETVGLGRRTAAEITSGGVPAHPPAAALHFPIPHHHGPVTPPTVGPSFHPASLLLPALVLFYPIALRLLPFHLVTTFLSPRAPLFPRHALFSSSLARFDALCPSRFPSYFALPCSSLVDSPPCHCAFSSPSRPLSLPPSHLLPRLPSLPCSRFSDARTRRLVPT